MLEDIRFSRDLIILEMILRKKSRITIQCGANKDVSLGEFQGHSAINSLKFRFNLSSLLSLKQ